MLYTLNLDKDNYILSVAHTDFDDVELNLDEMELEYLNAYQYTDGVLSFDENKKAQIIKDNQEVQKNEQIADLWLLLRQSDEQLLGFIEDLFSLKNPLTFISDMFNIMKNYSNLVINRQNIRQQIKKLEGE